MNNERWAHTYAAVMGVEVGQWGSGRTWCWKGPLVNNQTGETFMEDFPHTVPSLDANAIEILLERMQRNSWVIEAMADTWGAEYNKTHPNELETTYTIWTGIEPYRKEFRATAPHAHLAAVEAIAQAKGVEDVAVV